MLFQNANLSVRVTDEFMEAVAADKPWTTHWVTDPETAGPTYQAREMFTTIAQAAWACGDPGVQYDTTINRWHTCPNSGRINASNPCSEYMFLDDSACNLASINLMKFRRDDGTFDAERFKAACRLVFIAQEILVDHASYPTPRIAANSHHFRPLGLGYSNLGSLIMASGLPYDSDAARGLCGAITALLHGAAYRTSTELAAAVGPFDGYEENREPMLHVMEMHWEKVEQIDAAPQVSAGRRPQAMGRRAGPRPPPRLPQRPGHGAGPHRHHQLHDGLRYDGHRARHRPGEVQAVGRRRHAEDRQPDGAAGAARPWATTSPRSTAIVAYIDKHDTIEGAAGAEGRASAGVRLRIPAAQRHAVHSLEGPRPHDGGRPAVPLRGDFQDRQHAQGQHAGRRGRRLHGRLAAGTEGPGHLPRRVEGGAAGLHQEQGRKGGRRRSPPRAASDCPTRGSRSPTSSTSPGTRAISPWGFIPTAGPANCSSPWPRKAAPSAA